MASFLDVTLESSAVIRFLVTKKVKPKVKYFLESSYDTTIFVWTMRSGLIVIKATKQRVQ